MDRDGRQAAGAEFGMQGPEAGRDDAIAVTFISMHAVLESGLAGCAIDPRIALFDVGHDKVEIAERAPEIDGVAHEGFSV